MSRLRVLLIDDHQMLAEAIAAGLAATSDLWVLGRCTTDEPRLVEIVTSWRPDVVTIDVESLGVEAPGLIERIRATRPEVRIVVLTATHDPAVAVAVAQAGANAWLGMDVSLERLVTVLHIVHEGGACYPEDLLGTILRELREDARRARAGDGPLEVLSAREREVLLGMMEGKTGTEIARELFLSANTVRTHSRSILSKLDVHSRLEAVALARAAGMRPPGNDASTVVRSVRTT
ncbi:response regulator transcription factor [Pseudonocardia sp. K10HN5]|uniref:Response regulator transcription factor n=1 Tax=Pseudonocardia acidicola TaxID=2724939 RepID=A0ABX1S771_9PSEU|nr:response regulator transcription factor [Pseudonocardia acidicola]